MKKITTLFLLLLTAAAVRAQDISNRVDAVKALNVNWANSDAALATNVMPAFAAIESSLTNPPATWLDRVSIDAGVFVNTRSAQLKNCILAGEVRWSTGDNTYIAAAGFIGERMKGGAAVVGGLKSSGTVRIPIINYNLRTEQSVAAGLCYVTGTSGTEAYGITIPGRHGWENYVYANIAAALGAHFSVGISSLIIGPDVFLGAGIGVKL